MRRPSYLAASGALFAAKHNIRYALVTVDCGSKGLTTQLLCACLWGSGMNENELAGGQLVSRLACLARVAPHDGGGAPAAGGREGDAAGETHREERT